MLLWLDSTNGKPWVARITGLDPKFGLERTFLAPVDRKRCARAYQLEESTLYQVQPTDGEERFFLMIVAGEERALSTDDAMVMVNAMEEGKKKMSADVENAILRLNAEGGFRFEPSEN